MIRPTRLKQADSGELAEDRSKPREPLSTNANSSFCGGDSPTSTDSRPPSPAGASGPSSPAGAARLPDLIPVRMLNEFTYCRRLGYLEFVHGEWEENLETKQGTFGHRRVDKPDRKNVAPAVVDGRTEESLHGVSLTSSKDSSGQRKRLGGEKPPTSTDSPTPLPAEASRSPAEASRLHARSILLLSLIHI